MTENCLDKIDNVLLSASNSCSKIVDLKPTRTLTNSYIEALVLARRRARRDWQSSRSPGAKLSPKEVTSYERHLMKKKI